jgi:Zn-dependent alcohol dehydrogenase
VISLEKMGSKRTGMSTGPLNVPEWHNFCKKCRRILVSNADLCSKCADEEGELDGDVG